MKKTHPKSRFIYFAQGSIISERVLMFDTPTIEQDGKPVVILQIEVFNTNWFLCEYVYLKDYNKVKEKKE